MRSFNEFQRLLKEHGIEGKLALVMTEMYEFMTELNRQQDEHLKITVSLASTVENFVSLNEAMEGKLQGLNRLVSGKVDGVSVSSTPMRDDDGE